MLPVSEFDGNAPYADFLVFKGMDVPGMEGVHVLAHSIKNALPLQKHPVEYAAEKWNDTLGAYADSLRSYVEHVEAASMHEVSLHTTVEQLCAGATNLKTAMRTIRADADLHKYYKETAEDWMAECKRKYGVRNRNEAYIVARTLQSDDGCNAWKNAAKTCIKHARTYLIRADMAYADVVRQAVEPLSDKLSRRVAYNMRDDNLSVLRDESRTNSERLRASNALLQALPSAITKLAPHAVNACTDTAATSLRNYINAVRGQLEANTDQEPVWFHLYYNKLPADLQTAIHQHFSPTLVAIIPFEQVAEHIRRTYLSGEVLVTVLQDMRTRLTFDPKQKGAVTKFAMQVRLARDQLKDQFKYAINDFTMLSYINEWMGTGHWFAKEFHKYLLNKPVIWENISEALVFCTQHDALHEAHHLTRITLTATATCVRWASCAQNL